VPHARRARMFDTSKIKINEHGIDLKKNYQVVSHIDYREIKKVEFFKGHLIKNWILILIIGLIISFSALGLGVFSLLNFDLEEMRAFSPRGYLIFQVIPWILFLGGLIMIFQTFKKSVNILIETSVKKYQIPLKQLEISGKIEDLIDFMDSKTKLINRL
jgi:hypothetical protein